MCGRSADFRPALLNDKERARCGPRHCAGGGSVAACQYLSSSHSTDGAFVAHDWTTKRCVSSFETRTPSPSFSGVASEKRRNSATVFSAWPSMEGSKRNKAYE